MRALVIALGLLAACSAPAREQEAPVVQPAEDIDPGDTLALALRERARTDAARMIPQGAVMRGELDEGDYQDFQVVLAGGHCARILSAASGDVGEIELSLYDRNGVAVQLATPGRTPAIGIERALCPEATVQLRARARMHRGRGAFALRVYYRP